MSGSRIGQLYVISTPIGNLQDITYRAVNILRQVDYIVCEDTRVTRKLLTRYEISKPLISFHSKSSPSVVKRIITHLKEGNNLALVTDSGTPMISDPGCPLVKQALESGVKVSSIPGASAVHTAIASSGFCFAEYAFFGFLSSRAGKRKKRLRELKSLQMILVFYEAPHRLDRFLSDVQDVFGDIPVAVGKELTKRFEKMYRGKLSKVRKMLKEDGIRGEYTVVVDNRKIKGTKTGIGEEMHVNNTDL